MFTPVSFDRCFIIMTLYDTEAALVCHYQITLVFVIVDNVERYADS